MYTGKMYEKGECMKKALVLGAGGQIGSDLCDAIAKRYGKDQLIQSDVKEIETDYHFEKIDVLDQQRIYEVAKKHQVDTIINLAAILSGVGEKNPQLLWKINMQGLYNTLEVARELSTMLFVPSSIAAFGPSTQKDHTPQLTIQRPTTIYGVSKVSGELLCDYYHKRFGVDTRGVRFPGLISYKTLPGGGTTDYAVHIYFDAVAKKEYTSPIDAGTFMDMMYMPDAIDCILDLIEADPTRLNHRNAYNVSAMSIDPEMVKSSIQKLIPEFFLHYDVDPTLQKIAESWPNSLDVSPAKEDWDFSPKFDLDKMTQDMLLNIRKKNK